MAPQACPFVALAEDRDRRLDLPDDRHRCYAEQTPQPRTLAHQRAYCLAPAFPGCPVFLDWAARSAADPIPVRRELPSAALLAQPSDATGPTPTDSTPPASEAPAQAAATAASVETRPADPASREWATPPPWSDAGPSTQYPDPGARMGPAGGPPIAPQRPIGAPPMGSPPMGREQARPMQSNRRDSPEWSRPRRDEAYPELQRRSGPRAVPPLLLGIVGLAVAAAVLFLLPGLFVGGGRENPSATPTRAAVVTPTAIPTPSPSPTPVTYTVVAGDNLLRIARMFGLTVDQMACANGISDINRLQIGQVLVIPDDDFACAGSSPSPESSEPAASAS